MFKIYPGAKQLWVSSTKGTSTNPGTRSRPLSTVALAHTKCTANAGDVIIAMESHAESFTTASELTISKAGVQIVGLGQQNQRPTFTIDADVSGILISGAEVLLENVIIQAGFADVAKGMTITAADVVIDNVGFQDAAAAENFLTPIHVNGATDNDADGIQITNCTWYSVDTACLEFCQIDTDVARAVFSDNWICTLGTATVQGFLLTSGKSAQAITANNNVVRSQATTTVGNVIWGDQADNDGIVSNNISGHLDIAGEVNQLMAGAMLNENYGAAIVTVSAYILPARDVNS